MGEKTEGGRGVKRQKTLGECDGTEQELEAVNLIEFRFRETVTIRLASLDVAVNKSGQLGFG